MYVMIIVYTAFNLFGGTTMSGATAVAEFSSKDTCMAAAATMEHACDRYKYICVEK